MKKFCIMLIVFAMADSATAIIVPDASFEEAGAMYPGSWDYVATQNGLGNTPWVVTIYGGGPWVGNNYVNAYGYPQVGHDLNCYVDLNYSYIHQLLGATYVDGAIYEITAWATTYSTGQELQGFFTTGSSDGYNGGATMNWTEWKPVPQSGDNTWYELNWAYTATAADDGLPIGLVFIGDYDVCIDDIALEIVVPKAWGPDPYDEEPDVPLDKILSWNTGLDPNSGLLYTGITAHKVYMNDGTDDPNLFYVTTIAAIGATGQYTPVGEWSLARDGTYLWRIDELEPNALGGPDFVYTGDVWAFDTVLSVPVIDPATPADVMVYPGENAVFTVSATNPFTGDSTGMTYQWYKGVSTIGTNSPTLTISGADIADIDDYYCTVTLTSNSLTTDSRTASLEIKRFLGHWKLDETSGTTAADSEGIPAADGTLEGQQFRFNTKSVAGQIGTALSFDGVDDYVSLPALNLNSNTMTITAWVKANSATNVWSGIVFNRYASGANGISLDGTELKYHWNGGNWGWSSGLYVTVGEWTFVAMAVESDKATLSVNGAFATNTGAHAPEAFDVAGETQIGHDNQGAGDVRFFDGGIDDVRIYNYPLDPYAIAQLFVDGKPGEMVCVEYPLYDFDQNCIVDLGDLAELASQWLSCNIVPDCL